MKYLYTYCYIYQLLPHHAVLANEMSLLWSHDRVTNTIPNILPAYTFKSKC